MPEIVYAVSDIGLQIGKRYKRLILLQPYLATRTDNPLVICSSPT